MKPWFFNTNIRWLLLPLMALYCVAEAFQGLGDFYIYLSAASDLDGSTNIFEKKYVDGYHYFYSVFFALLLKPLAFLPYYWLRFGWLLLNGVLYLDLLRLLYRCTQLQQLSVRKRTWFMFLVFLASLRFFTDNIHTSQVTILILWCSIRGLAWIFENKNVRGAAVLALGINIKLLPIVFLPYLLFRARWKAAALCIIFCLALYAFPSLLIGHSYNMDLMSTWLSLINPANQAHVLDVEERSFHGLSTLLSTLFVKDVPDVYALPLVRNIADVSIEALSGIILTARLTLIFFSFYFLKWSWFREASSSPQKYAEQSYILLVIPLIFPHQQHYAFLFAIPAFAFCLYLLMLQPSRKGSVLLFIVYLSFNLKLLLGEFNAYYEHYKILSYGALLLIVLMAIQYKKIKEKDQSR